MNRLLSRLLSFGLLVLFSCPLLANQTAMLPDSPLVITPVGNSQFFIDYQSQRLPKWNFSVEINRSYAERFADDYRRVPVTMLELEAVSVSARRALPVKSTQWFYATLRATQYFLTPQASAMPLAGDRDRAASVGWQFGELDGFNIAVGYEYRDVGEIDLNSLVMGVQYHF